MLILYDPISTPSNIISLFSTPIAQLFKFHIGCSLMLIYSNLAFSLIRPPPHIYDLIRMNLNHMISPNHMIQINSYDYDFHNWHKSVHAWDEVVVKKPCLIYTNHMIFTHHKLIWVNLNHMIYSYHMIQIKSYVYDSHNWNIANHKTYRPFSLNLITGGCQF